jgi:hypothetical protein
MRIEAPPIRARQPPATTTTTAGWTQELVANVLSELLVSLGPARRRITVARHYESITVPAVVASASNAGFVGQGAPIPVRQLSTSGRQTRTSRPR